MISEHLHSFALCKIALQLHSFEKKDRRLATINDLNDIMIIKMKHFWEINQLYMKGYMISLKILDSFFWFKGIFFDNYGSTFTWKMCANIDNWSHGISNDHMAHGHG